LKLKKASAWFYNKGTSNIVINELGLTVKKGEIVDLFAKNPHLRYEKYLESKTNGVLNQKKEVLVPVAGPPVRKQYSSCLEESKEPLKKRIRSAKGMNKEDRDWVELLEEEFPSSALPLSDKDRWDLERKKMLESLEIDGQGEEGEVFSDHLFDDSDDIDI
jgi:hypothetical protein